MHSDTAAGHARGLSTMLAINPIEGPQKKGPRRFWTTVEERILREHYPLVGAPGCVALLPGRSFASIYGHANTRLKLKAPAATKAESEGRTRQNWQPTPEIDEMIKEHYPECTGRRDVARLAISLERPRWWVSHRAQQLGLVSPRFKEADWTKDEIDLITPLAHMNPQVIVRKLRKAGYVRSATAVTVKLKRLSVTTIDPHHFTAGGFAKLLGVDLSLPSTWIEKGWLKATRRGTTRVAVQGGDMWWIKRSDAYRFILEHAARIDIRKVDKLWFIEFLSKHGRTQ